MKVPIGNAMYKTMEDADIPEHLLHTIAKRVHKDYHKGICTYVETMFSLFERIFRENEVVGSQVLEKLCDVYPELKIRVDEYCEWLTVVLKLNATKFIVFHEYKEYGVHDHLVAEGEMVDGNMVFERFMYKKMWRKEKLYSSASTYFAIKGTNYIPFQFTNSVMGGAHNVKGVEFSDAPAHTTWYHPNDLLRWFLDCEREIWRPIIEEHEEQDE
jgi:hypothetical protein